MLPSYLVFLGLATGITLAHFGCGVLTGIFVIGGAAALIWFENERGKTAAILFSLLIGFLYFNWTDLQPPVYLPAREEALTGKIDSFPAHNNNKTSFYLITTTKNIYLQKIKVSAYFNAAVDKGDIIKLKGSLKPPSPPSNPGEFNYPSYLAQRQVYYVMSVKAKEDLTLIQSSRGIAKLIANCRQRGENVFNRILPREEASLLTGMLLGDIDAIDPERNLDFQKTGIFHAFSVSGLHIGFLLLLNGWLMSLLHASRKAKLASGIALLVIYGSLVGWPVCVWRAAIMGGLGALAYYSGRQNSLLNALALSGIIILLINPHSLLDVSFQLSFAATLGLIYIFPQIRTRIKPGFLTDIILLPLCAEIMVLPLIAYYFNLFSPVSLLTNILTGYVTGGIVILGFMAFAVAQLLPLLAAVFLYPAGFLIEILLVIVDFLKNIPGAYRWTGLGITLVVLYYTAFVLFLWALAKERRQPAAAGVAVMVLITAGFYLPAGLDSYGRLEVTFIDVGQGDSALIKTPGGKFILVDGGGNRFYDVASLKLLPYLHRRGINQLFMVINTHPDIDHFQGLKTVVAKTPVSYLAIPSSLYNAPEYRDWKTERGKNLLLLTAGQILPIEKGVYLQILLPDGSSYAVNNYNNQSVVCKVSYGRFSLVLMGDTEKDAIDHLLKQDQIETATVIKVPHHGSRYSAVEALYDQVNPDYAVISVGKNNTFGHPAPDLVRMLQGKGIKVLRTDQDGAIIMKTDGVKLEIKQFLANT